MPRVRTVWFAAFAQYIMPDAAIDGIQIIPSSVFRAMLGARFAVRSGAWTAFYPRRRKKLTYPAALLFFAQRVGRPVRQSARRHPEHVEHVEVIGSRPPKAVFDGVGYIPRADVRDAGPSQ